MKIGISVTSYLPSIADPREDPRNLAEQARATRDARLDASATGDIRSGARNMIERARASRDAGLDSLFLGDQHVSPYPYLQNNVMLARMLAEWGDKPFGALYLLPLWHPVILAEQIGTLASLSKGRFIMQCGLGDERAGQAMGIDMSKKVGMFVASLNSIRALWRGDSVDEPKYWNLSQAKISPVPTEYVDIWGCSLVDKSIERTARLAEGWLAAPNLSPSESGKVLDRYMEYCAKHGRVPKAKAIRRDIYIGSSSKEAKKISARYLEKGYRGMPEDALLIGSPAEVVDKIGVLAEQGFTDVIVRNISSNQLECMACIERLREVKEQLK